MPDNVYDIQNLCFSFKKNHCLINDFSWKCNNGKLVALIGKNGCGKSTLLKILCGIIKLYDGTISFLNANLLRYSAADLAKNLSYMCQLTADSIPLSVRDIVALGRYAYAGSQTDTQNDSVYYALSVCGISHLADEPYDKLSGGQQQKVMLARAICQNKSIMLLDEPTSALDIVAKKQIMNTLSDLSKNSHSLVILSGHDIDLIKLYADEILYFKDSRIFSISPNELTDGLINDIFT